MLLVTLNYRVLIRKHRATSQTSTLPRAPTVDLEKNRRNTVSAGQLDSPTIGAGSVGPAEGASMRTRISDETTGPHLKIADVQIRVEEERSVRSAEKDVFSVQPDSPPSETTRLAMSSSNSTSQDPSAPASSSAPSFNFAKLLSAQLIGALLDFMLVGAFLVQLVIYRICFPKDSRVIQVLVYGLTLLTLLRISLIGYQTQNLFAAGFGDVSKLATELQHQYSYPLVPTTICIVQHFFSYRIFSLERRCWPICILISILSLAQCGAGLADFALFFSGPDALNDELRILHDLGLVWYAGGVTTALINTLTTAFILLRVHGANLNQSTQQAVRRVVRVTVESNAASAAVEIISLALLQALPDDPYYVGTTFLLPGVYSNMLLITLNYRALVRQQRATSTSQRAPPVDLEKNPSPRNTTPPLASQRDSETIGAGSVGPAEGASVRTRISDETTRHHHGHGPHLKIGDMQIRVEEERSVVSG
uniref:DUF6534 domain-containing protein n=1 Tax=Mycena chlorophos TaxID=658473 RepID=A0ABQ0LLG6_MYCCL|nr:predicted protein [Mycena chlorophos]